MTAEFNLTLTDAPPAAASGLRLWALRPVGFYERNGYRTFGQLPVYPQGNTRHFLSKDL